MQRRKHRYRRKECDDALRRKCPRPTRGDLPRRDEKGIDESREVEEDGIEGDDTHALQRVAVDDVRSDDGIAHLDTGGEKEEGDLADDPVVCAVNGYAPDYESDYSQGVSRGTKMFAGK